MTLTIYTCKQCGDTTHASGSLRLGKCPKCRATKLVNLEKEKAKKKALPSATPVPGEEPKEPTLLPITTRCRGCGKQHSRKRLTRLAKYCSDSCMAAAQKARKYHITVDQLQERYEEQDGCCAICGVEDLFESLCVDHSHKTDEVRGLLCRSCNVGLGMFKDYARVLRRAAEYLGY